MATEVYELRINGIHNAQYTQNVLHFQGVGTNPADTMAGANSLIAGFLANVQTPFLTCLPSSWFLMSLQAKRVSAAPNMGAYKQFAFQQVPGTGGSTGDAYQLCPSIFLVPGMGFKSGGKIFMPTVAQGSIIGNALQSAYQAAIASFIAALIAGFTNAGITWANGVWSRKLRTFSATQSGHVSPLIGYQKRRRSAAGVD